MAMDGSTAECVGMITVTIHGAISASQAGVKTARWTRVWVVLWVWTWICWFNLHASFHSKEAACRLRFHPSWQIACPHHVDCNLPAHHVGRLQPTPCGLQSANEGETLVCVMLVQHVAF